MLVPNTPESEAVIPQLSEVIARPFDHICQTDGSLDSNEYFGPILQRDGSGICWAASMSMAVASLTGEGSEDVLQQIGLLTYDYFPKHFADIQSRLRETHGPNGVVPFVENGIVRLVTWEGSLQREMRLKYPTQTSNLFNLFLTEAGFSDLSISINPRSLLSVNDPINEISQSFSEDSVPVMSVDIREEFKDGRRNNRYTGHMVFISGVRKEDDRVVALRITDPNRSGPIWIDTKRFFVGGEFIYREDNISKSFVHPSLVGTLLWFQRKPVKTA